MNNKFTKISIQIIFFSFQLICNFGLVSSQIFALENSENINKISLNLSNNENNFYILGPGDILEIIVTRKQSKYFNDLNRIVEIDSQGFINLSRLKRLNVSGLTVEELIIVLNNQYKEFLKEPKIEVFLKQYRPVEVFLDGELEDPGLRVISPGNELFSLFLDENIQQTQSEMSVNYFPSVFDAIRLAGGVSPFADLSKIEVTRINSKSNGGGRIKTTLNLINAIELNDTSQNIKLRDGDTIFIPKTDQIVLSQLTKAKKANFNPKYIKVFIGGRVRKEGTKNINKMSVLNDAIYIAGGAKYLKGPVNFLRYNGDGTTERRTFKYQKNAERGSYSNPYLKDGDVVFVGDSVVNITSDLVGEITSPVKGLFEPYLFYKILKD